MMQVGRKRAMSNDFIDHTAPSLQRSLLKRPEDLPHGLLAVPAKVRELIEEERPKHLPEAFAKAEERLLNDWTLQYYFDYLGHEVLYRATPKGPEVLAVGFEEIDFLSFWYSASEQPKASRSSRCMARANGQSWESCKATPPRTS
jgi:hypothetical protein